MANLRLRAILAFVVFSADTLPEETKSCARKCERCCCAVATYFPLSFIYSLTTWAVYVEAGVGFRGSSDGARKSSWFLKPTSALGVVLYLLLNICYTVAVFTDPGSPTKTTTTGRRAQYSSLPTVEPTTNPPFAPTITVSSTGNQRYCKKCQSHKPDRTHHCSTCRRCVMKMDHHCPWLATCLGLHNYKPFVLFLIYVSIFCWVCFFSTAWWVWKEIFEQNQYLEDFAPVNIILLAVISGIIGLVITGFTSWHLYLCFKGQTTIECLEKTRYLTGMRNKVERQRQDQIHQHNRGNSNSVTETLQRAGEQILEFHANAVPGASRYEEGEEHTSPIPSHTQLAGLSATESQQTRQQQYFDTPAQRALRQTYSAVEQQRERARYEEYMDDKESAKLPNAFDMGWRKNLLHLFGPNPLLWFLPVCNTTGDGWRWEISPKWIQATEEAAQRRAERLGQHQQAGPNSNVQLRGGSSGGGGGGAGVSGYDDANNLEDGEYYSRSAMSMQTLNRPGHAQAKSRRREFDRGEDGEVDQFEVSTDEDTDDAWQDRRPKQASKQGHWD